MAQTHICVFTDNPAPGDIGTHIAFLLERMDPQRYTSHLVCPATATELIARAAAAGAIYHPLSGRGGDPERDTPILTALAREMPIHLFHAHISAGLEGAWAIRAAHAAGVPVILATEHLPYSLPPGPATEEKTAVNRLVDRILVVAEEARYSHVASGAAQPGQVVIIPQGIDPVPFLTTDPQQVAALRQQLGLEGGGPVVGMFAPMYEQKGHRHLLDAWPAVRVAVPDATLLLAGNGPLRNYLEYRAEALGIADSVRFLGAASTVPALLELCTLVVVPSVFEGFPLTVLEAMAAARPVIGTRVCGVGEAIVEGETGRLVPPEDPDALGLAIVRLLRAPLKARRMGQAGRLRVVRAYHIHRMIEATCTIYETLLKEKARPYAVAAPDTRGYTVL